MVASTLVGQLIAKILDSQRVKRQKPVIGVIQYRGVAEQKIRLTSQVILRGPRRRAAERLELQHLLRAPAPHQSESGQAMKSQRTVGLTLPSKPCQRPSCSNLGRRRLQRRGRIIRSFYLCDWCLESL